MTKPYKTPSWLERPLVLCGNWEPLIYRRRLNCLGTDGAEKYWKEHTPELVAAAKKAGVTLIVTHYFKGFGLKGELEDIEAAEKLIKLCHDRDIRVAGYIGDTLVRETMLLEEPDAMDWVQRKPDGSPLTYGGTLTYRLKWCRNNPAFLTYMKRVLERGVKNGLDMLHFDNFLDKPEPKTCHCRHCADKFRSFLMAKYHPAELKERFGFPDVSCVEPPTFSSPLYVCYGDDVIQNPLLQEWIDFRCQSLADSFKALADFARSLNPETVIESNPTGIWGENTAYMRSVDHVRLLPHSQLFWDESPNPHGLLKNGALPTGIRSMKMGEAFGNRALFYGFAGRQEEVEAKLGEALAFNGGCIGMISFIDGDTLPDAAKCAKFVELLHSRPELFCGTRSVARAAVYRNFPSLAYNGWEPHLQAILAEQTLLQNHIPFDLIYDLSEIGDRLMIVSGMECLSDEEIRGIRRHVERGGNVVLVGNVGIYDQWRRRRCGIRSCDTGGVGPVNIAKTGVYGEPRRGRPDPFAYAFKGKDVFGKIGRGVIARFPELELPRKAPLKRDRAVWDDFYKVVDGRFWILPSNAGKLMALLDGGKFGDLRPVKTNAGINTFVEPRILADEKTLVVHVINYDARVLGGRLELIASKSIGVKKATLLVPGRKPVGLKVDMGKDSMRLNFENSSIYACIMLWE